MEDINSQIEKNLTASFAYVKKDMLMLNDAFSDLHDKVQHLSLNHAMLLEEIGKLRHEMARLHPMKKSIAVSKTSSAKKKSSKKTTKKKK